MVVRQQNNGKNVKGQSLSVLNILNKKNDDSSGM